jgi:hypothetical protein
VQIFLGETSPGMLLESSAHRKGQKPSPAAGHFRTAAGEAFAISIPRTEAAVIRHFQERMPNGLFVPDVP